MWLVWLDQIIMEVPSIFQHYHILQTLAIGVTLIVTWICWWQFYKRSLQSWWTSNSERWLFTLLILKITRLNALLITQFLLSASFLSSQISSYICSISESTNVTSKCFESILSLFSWLMNLDAFSASLFCHILCKIRINCKMRWRKSSKINKDKLRKSYLWIKLEMNWKKINQVQAQAQD